MSKMFIVGNKQFSYHYCETGVTLQPEYIILPI